MSQSHELKVVIAKWMFYPLTGLFVTSVCLIAIAEPSTRPARAFARYVPEAYDDVAWENDRIAFRVYGPGLEKEQATGSGIDVWVKSTRKMIINAWYKSDDYAVNHGEGLDFYSVNTGRGCGGLGIWNGKSIDVSRVWKSHKIIESGPDRAVIELTYAPWTSLARKVWETRRITLEAGSNLNRIESTIDSDSSAEMIVAIGVNERSGEGGQATFDKKKGLLSYWQPAEGINGSIAVGVLVGPSAIEKLIRADHHYLALIHVIPGHKFVYYAGAGWSKSGDFPNLEAWEKYLREFVTHFPVDP